MSGIWRRYFLPIFHTIGLFMVVFENMRGEDQEGRKEREEERGEGANEGKGWERRRETDN